MTESRTTPLSRSLLEAARQDGPSVEQRARIWDGVALAPQLSLVATVSREAGRESLRAAASSAGASVAGTVAGAVAASKFVMAGVLVGSALTAGVGLLVLGGGRHGHPDLAARGGEVRTVATPLGAGDRAASRSVGAAPEPQVAPAVDDSREPVGSDTRSDLRGALPAAQGSVERSERARAGGSAAHGRGEVTAPGPREHDALMREAAIVSQARTELVQGRPAAALELLDRAARASTRSLEPEELSLRVRALRLLGREGEASLVEETLKARYPESFLAR